jgi:hypothetical protein
MRADAASRPARHEVEAAPVIAAAPVPIASTIATAPTASTGAESAPHGKRYVLSVMDASEDDVHQALSNLPPAASYRLIPESEA